MLKFELIQNDEQFEAWRKFAATFDHDTDRPTTPLVTVSDGDKMIGHFHSLRHPVVVPAFHPSISKRKFVEVVEAISNHFCISSMSHEYPNGVIYVALPKNMPVNHSEKMGFLDLGINLYQRIPK